VSPRHAITELGRKEDGDLEEPAGLPALAEGHVLPPDLLAFYAVCGGLTLRRERVRIVPPAAFLLAGDGRYVLAEGTDARRPVPVVSIDLDRPRSGRCYTGGRELPIADSFTAFLTALAFRGVFWR
jgi:hypothetical protein